MIEELGEKIARIQLKKPYVVIGIFALITLLLIPGIFNLIGNVEPSLEKVLPQHIEEVQNMNNMRSQFGADMMYLLVYPDGPVSDVRDPKLLQYIDALSQRLETHEVILRADSLATIIRRENNGLIPNDPYLINDIISSYPGASEFKNGANSLTIIQLKTDTGSSAVLIKEAVESVKTDIASLEEMNPGARIEITGFNAIDKATFEVIMSDFASITLVSMLLVALVVFITFRSLIKGMLPMVVVVMALLWTMGIVGYLGLTITVVSMVAAAMIMGLGIDFGIHTVHSYFELRKKFSADEALKEMMRELLRAMLGASTTTMAGFLALLFGVLPAMKTLAIILALGIFNTLLGAIFVLPVIVYLFDTFKVKNRKLKLF